MKEVIVGLRLSQVPKPPIVRITILLCERMRVSGRDGIAAYDVPISPVRAM
jgi:hypothetical protein